MSDSLHRWAQPTGERAYHLPLYTQVLVGPVVLTD